MKKLAMIVPVLNQFELFTNMMSTVDYPIHPYVITNWDNNLGVAAGWNQGIKRAMKDGYRYAIIVNDDILLEKNAIKDAFEYLLNSDAIIVSPNFCVPERDGLRMYFDRNIGVNESIHWSCYVVDMYKLIEICGWFDENFFPAYFEDNDMYYRIHLAGQKHYLVTRNGFYHKQSATTGVLITKDHWNYCENYYRAKWGGIPGEERFTKPFNDDNNAIDYWSKPNAI